MNIWKATALLTTFCVALSLSVTSEAKRLGGGGSTGMQRSAPAKAPANATPAQQAAPQQAPTTPPQAAPTPAAQPAPVAAAPAQPPKRSWLGPLAGLAAGIGLAALLSHFGMGEAVANFLMMALLAIAAVFVIRLILSKMRGPQTAAAAAGSGAESGSILSREPSLEPATPSPVASPSTMARTAEVSPVGAAPGGPVSVTGQPLAPLHVDSATPATAAASSQGLHLPAGFDQAAFERLAKMIFIRLQAANDAGNLDDLRQFTTPEMFAAIRLELQDRQGAAQTTDVERVDAQVVDFATEGAQQIVTVRFHGMIKEAPGAASEAFDELWHLVRPVDESHAWAIAGIQQSQ